VLVGLKTRSAGPSPGDLAKLAWRTHTPGICQSFSLHRAVSPSTCYSSMSNTWSVPEPGSSKTMPGCCPGGPAECGLAVTGEGLADDSRRSGQASLSDTLRPPALP
jgi:hypothetical protein